MKVSVLKIVNAYQALKKISDVDMDFDNSI
jgi:hypothetical protein